MKNAFATPLLKRLAPKAGVKIDIEPSYRYAGQITLRDCTKRYFRGTNFDLNPLGASEIAKDKTYAAYFMRKMGYRVVKGQSFFSKQWGKTIGSRKDRDAAYRFAKRLGFPIIVKPNSLSQGAGVCLVRSRKEFSYAVREIEKKDRVFRVERIAVGQDYRIVVLDNEIMSAYERLPLMVTGNGRSTIKKLLAQKQRLFVQTDRDTIITQDDFRIGWHLKYQGFRLSTILPKGKIVTLLDNKNLSSGGDAIDVTSILHPSFKQLAIRLVRDMGLRYCGVDLMVEGDISKPLARYKILEINAAPGIDNYAKSGLQQKRIVESMYLKVLKAMAKKK
ncbi:MAG: cyanophycin synthetase [bacterium]|nr:cyanophycin synthetase [bacterium]